MNPFAKNAGAERNRRRDEKAAATEEPTYLRLGRQRGNLVILGEMI